MFSQRVQTGPTTGDGGKPKQTYATFFLNRRAMCIVTKCICETPRTHCLVTYDFTTLHFRCGNVSIFKCI